MTEHSKFLNFNKVSKRALLVHQMLTIRHVQGTLLITYERKKWSWAETKSETEECIIFKFQTAKTASEREQAKKVWVMHNSMLKLVLLHSPFCCLPARPRNHWSIHYIKRLENCIKKAAAHITHKQHEVVCRQCNWAQKKRKKIK